MAKESFCSDVIEVLKHYKDLSDFIENEVPYNIAEDIRQDLYLNDHLDNLITRLEQVKEAIEKY